MRKFANPQYSNPVVNRRVLLSKRPHGIPRPSDFTIDQTDVPRPDEGRFVVRNIYLSVDPAQRGWASTEANYSTPVELGTPMRALAVGAVVASCDGNFPVGEFLYGWFGWQDYCLAGSDAVIRRLDPSQASLSASAGLLGINGMTAYLGLTRIGRPQPGETVLVSTAAGAVGSLVGQIARLMGCRTVGLTGSDEKVERCRTRFGYDQAFNYNEVNLGNVLRSAAPDGLNVYFDSTGGVILDTALRHMAVGGRVVQCGTASVANWEPAPIGLRNEREVLTKRLQWSGFVIFDHAAMFDDVAKILAEWYAQDKIVADEDISCGIEAAPYALDDLYAGKNTGKKLIFVG